MRQTVLSVSGDAVAPGVRNQALRDAGFEVVEAATAADALKLASEKQPALIVLAIDLPGMDGLEVCRRLKADPRTAFIPVLHIPSSGGPLGGYPESLESGADAYLRAPLDPPTLISVAKALIRARSGGALQQERAALDAMAQFPEQNPAPALRVSRDGALLYANASAKALMADWICQVGQNVPGDLRRAVEEALAQGAPAEFEVRSGGRDYSFEIAPIAGYGYANLYGRDLTQRKRLAQQLRERVEELETVMEVAPVAIWVAHDARCEEITGNRMADRFYEAGAGENVSANVTEARRFFQGGRELQAQELPMQEAAARNLDIRDSELDVLLPSGARMNMLGNASPLRDASGHVRGCVGTFLDITGRKRAEDALRESEAVLRGFFDSPGVMRGFVDLIDGRIVHVSCNAAAAEMYGVDRESIAGKLATEAGAADEVARLWVGLYEESRRTAKPVSAEYARRDAGGQERWLLATACYLGVGPSGNPRFAYAILDLTERKRAEEALRESEERYRTMFDTMLEGFCIIEVIFDADEKPVDYRFLELNAAFEAQTGLKDARGRLMRDLAPEHEAHWFEIYGQVALTGQPARFVNEARALGRWYDVSAYRVGESGSRRVAILFNDISKRMAALEALRESEVRERARAAEVEALMDAAPAAIFVARDSGCRSMTGNRAAHEMLRRPSGLNLSKSAPEAERPMNFRAMKDGVEVALEELPVQKAAFTGRPVRNSELDLVFEDGSTVNLVGDAVPLLDEHGNPRGAVAVLSDITELKRAETRLRESQKLESLGMLAGGVAHDFNNLLVGVIGNASLAQEWLPEGNPAAELLEGVIKSGEQAAHLTRQMLAYSGKGKFVVEPLDLSALIPEMSGLVRPSISKKIPLHLDLAPDLPPIEADRGQVQQVFMNLALNAAEAIGSHDGVISVRTGVEDVDERYLRLHPAVATLRPGKHVCLEVRDTGCGMDEATMAKIFDPFYTTKFLGRGLGLAAVAGILRGHKGAIGVTSAPGKGSCFTVLFPAAAHAGGERPAPAGDPALQGAGTVLVVDDESVVRETAKRALERHGYTVLLAESGLAAIDVFRRHPGEIALVVLDLSMPLMSGEETLPELRKIRPHAKVVVSSGYSEAETMALFKGQKVSGFIQKPYTSKGLAEKVKAWIA